MLDHEEIRQRLKKLKNKIEDIAPEEVNIVAVTKTFPQEIYWVCSKLGLDRIGENKLQELNRKMDEAVDLGIGDKPEIHFIGHLQTNKIKLLRYHVTHFDSLSSEHQLNELENFWSKNDLGQIPVLIQINSTGEPSKSGIPAENEKELFKIIGLCEGSKYVRLEGLMSIGPTPQLPAAKEPRQEQSFLETTRQCFAQTRKLKEHIEQKLNRSLPRLSMGMSHDFEIALKEGANEIRIGSSLFGERYQH